jgi:hypothetical protein
MREAGFDPPADPALPAKLRELRQLEKTIGPAGRRALAPLLPQSAREQWEVHMLEEATS